MAPIIEVSALWSDEQGLCSPTTLLVSNAGGSLIHAETGGVLSVLGTSRIVGWGERDAEVAVVLKDEGFGGSFLLDERVWNRLQAEAA